MFEVKADIEIDRIYNILKKRGLETNGAIQSLLTNEILRLADPYTPFDNGILKKNVMIGRNNDCIIYSSPYARYMWYGKLMVDPVTGKGAFFKEGYGFWSHPKTPKVLSDINLKYQGAPMRGPFWVNRMWADKGEEIIEEIQKIVDRGGL